VKGSTPDLYWKNKWFRELKKAKIEYLQTTELEQALAEDKVDAIVSWDPWISEWLSKHADWKMIRGAEFHSVLNVGTMWALGDSKAETPRAKRLISLLAEAMELLKMEQADYDMQAAELGDWSLETVQTVVSQNQNLSRHKPDLSLTYKIQAEMEASIRFVHPKMREQDRFFGTYLLEGRFPSEKLSRPQKE